MLLLPFLDARANSIPEIGMDMHEILDRTFLDRAVAHFQIIDNIFYQTTSTTLIKYLKFKLLLLSFGDDFEINGGEHSIRFDALHITKSYLHWIFGCPQMLTKVEESRFPDRTFSVTEFCPHFEHSYCWIA